MCSPGRLINLTFGEQQHGRRVCLYFYVGDSVGFFSPTTLEQKIIYESARANFGTDNAVLNGFVSGCIFDAV